MGKKVNRKYKDRLFRFIFGDRRELLTLYNALNGTDYKDADKLEIVTLEDVIYMNMKNDVAFLFGAELNLWEHQSSRNPNMPVREAVRRCMRKGILADILAEHTEEVVEMFLTDYDFEEHMKMEREENYAVGHADGKEEGKAEGKAEAICDILEDIGSLPDEWRHRIMSEENLDILKEWLKIARRAESPEDFFKKSGLDKFV